MTPTKAKAGITKPVIDVDKTLDEDVKREAANAEIRAVLSEIEARQYEILDDLQPDRGDVASWRERFGGIAANRRRRADGILRRSGVKSRDDLPGIKEQLVPMVAQRLSEFQRAQVLLDEKEANLDLYALSAEEAELEAMRNASLRDPTIPPPENADQIKLNVAQNRAAVMATTEWLEANGPGELVDAADPMRQAGVDAARKFFGIKAPKADAEADAG